MMTRWLFAGLAALGLAFLTLPVFPSGSLMPWGASAATDAPGRSVGRTVSSEPLSPTTTTSACEPDAKPANLDFTIKDMNGESVHLADYKGKVILFDFWATWCGPCKVEIPGFVELQDKYRDQGLVVLGLSVDDTVDKLKPFAEEFKMNYPVLVGLGRSDVQDAYGPIWGLPTTFIISRDGKICAKHVGMASKEQFEADIKGLL